MAALAHLGGDTFFARIITSSLSLTERNAFAGIISCVHQRLPRRFWIAASRFEQDWLSKGLRPRPDLLLSKRPRISAQRIETAASRKKRSIRARFGHERPMIAGVIPCHNELNDI